MLLADIEATAAAAVEHIRSLPKRPQTDRLTLDGFATYEAKNQRWLDEQDAVRVSGDERGGRVVNVQNDEDAMRSRGTVT